MSWPSKEPTRTPRSIEGDRCDIAKLKALSDAEIEAARAVPEPEPPPAPKYLRTARQPGDSTSRLGLIVGACERDIKVTSTWAWHAFNLPRAAIVGAVSAACDSQYPADFLELVLFDAFGAKLVQAQLRGTPGGRVISSRFDELRLEGGDYLIAWSAPAGLCGRGTYKTPHTGRFKGALPTRPLLDELLSEPETDSFGQPVSVGMPLFHIHRRRFVVQILCVNLSHESYALFKLGV
jgi:hypothetical protein